LATDYPATNRLKAGIVVPYDPLGYFNEFRIVETLFFTLTGAVLVVVCLNISGMMLVRSAMRERELSIRHAIGASRGRLVRYLLSEAIVLAGLGAVLASVVIFNAPRLFSWLTEQPLPFEVQEALKFDPLIVAICSGLCLATSLIFGLLPATRFSRPVIISSLKDDAGGGGFRGGSRASIHSGLQVGDRGTADRLERHRSSISSRVTATGEPGIRRRRAVRGAVEVRRSRARAGRVENRSVRDDLGTGERRRVHHGRRWPAPGSSIASATGIAVRVGARTSARKSASSQTTRVGETGYLETMRIPGASSSARLHQRRPRRRRDGDSSAPGRSPTSSPQTTPPP
jgi:hypothetical protein